MKWKSRKVKSIQAAIKFVKKDLANHYWTLRDDVPYICWRESVPNTPELKETIITLK